MPGWAECADPKEWRKAVGVRGLYALLNGMLVVYVGKAERSIVARVRMHRKEGLMYSTPIAGWTSDTILSWTWEAWSGNRSENLIPMYNLRIKLLEAAKSATRNPARSGYPL